MGFAPLTRFGAVLGVVALATSAGAEPRAGLTGAYLAAQHAAALRDVEAAARLYGEALERDPENQRLMEAALINLIASGRVDRAAPVARRLAEVAPDHRIANLALTVEDVAAGRFEAARERFEGETDGFHPLVGRLLEGWTLYALGDREAAEATLARLESRGVFRLFGRFHTGLIRQLDGDAEGAVEAFESAMTEVPRPTSRLARAHGAALETLGRTDEARALYEETLAGNYADQAIAAELARLDAGRPPEPLLRHAADGAAEALNGLAGALAQDSGRSFALLYARLAAHLRPDLTSAALLVAEILEAEGQHELAVAAYEQVPTDSPLWRAAQIGRAEALDRLDRAEAAAEALRGLVARAPEAVEAHVALGDLMRASERYEEAAEAYTAAVDLLAAEGRDDWRLRYQRGIAYERADRWENAEADFEAALALEPDQPLVLNYLGYSWVEMGRNLERAREMIETAVELRPGDGYITDSLGWVLYRLGDYEGAADWLEKAVELAPVDPIITDHYGDALWKVGRRLEAEFQWRRALSFEPEEEDAARIRRKLAEGLDAVLAAEEAEKAAAAVKAAADRDGG